MSDPHDDDELLASVPPEVRAWVEERIPLHIKKRHGTAAWFVGMLHLRMAASHIEAAGSFLEGTPENVYQDLGHETAEEMLDVFNAGVREMVKWELGVLALEVESKPGSKI